MLKKRQKILIILLVLILTSSISITAFADTVRITDRNPDYEYFDYYSASGSWTGLLTSKHLVRDSNPEIVAYCIEKKVLLCDIDTQSNLTMCMGFHNPDELSCTMAHLIKSKTEETYSFQKKDFIQHKEGCDIIPSSIQLAGM